ncbi:TSC22 domain family protein 1 isoform X1 [Dromaius novaehollandiae]|uniref:TSC22 domain family protein 1 isoform X1 n=2 Tax=Dromaius novaehollandiae TaxID=8790 RepID=UPI000E1F6559|nr:TSC22 domain family protein 1 isoform X1 [Dromaius novaehollandiae]
MHQPDSAADISARKMAHPAMFPRRGSSSSSGSSCVTAPNAPGTGVGSGALAAEDYQPPLLVQPMPPSPAVSSSAGPQPTPPPPQSLNLLSQSQLQPQPLAQTGAQMKKKSGFQITSVTPAQISASMSSNNSIAEDTESYDDLDESHTEDLSSSEILDVSLSRATDLGEPERSSSEETLNNFQEAETPGAVSPNQPHLPQQHPSLPHHPQQSVVINGNVHPHHVHHHHHLHHHHHGHHHPSHPGVGTTPVSGGPPPSPSFRKLSTTGSSDNVISTAPVSAASSTGSPASVLSNIRTTSTPGSLGASPAAGTSTLSNISGGSSSVASSMLGTVNLSNIPSTGNVNALSGTSSNVNVNILSGVGNGTSASSNVINNVTNPAAGMAVGSSQQQPAAGTSRFRVVKLDSSSEPFKKGRWTCTEFYDKENTVAVTEGVAVNKAVETIKQNPLEVTSERESTSGSSVSSNVSTLSHYTESVGSGEMGAPTVVQQQAFQGVGPQQMDFSSAAPPAIPASSIPQSVSQSQLAQVQLHSQEVSYPQQKQGVQPPAQASLTTVTGVQPAPVNILGVSPSLGHQQPAIQSMAQQQLPYSQAAQPVQTLPVVQQQQLQYGQQQQQQTVPTQMTVGHVKPVNQNSVTGAMPDYIQHQQILQTPAPAMQPGSAGVGAGAPVPLAQAPSMQPSVQAHPAAAPAQPVAHAPASIPGVGTGGQMLGVGQQGSVATVVQPPSAANQIPPPVMPSAAAPPSSQVVQPVQAGIMQQGLQASASGLPQQMVIAQQNTLLPVQPQAQAVESVVQGMTSQQLPAVSPIPSASTVPAPSQASTAVPPGIPSASLGLGQPQSIAQASAVQNGNLAQSVSQPPLISTSIGMSVAQSMPQQIPVSSTQFPAQSVAQSIVSQIEDGRRPTEPSLAGLPQAAGGDSSVGASAVSDGSGSSMPSSASLFPLKVLPLTSHLVDGEDESSSGASVVAIDNKIEQAMDLVKSHLMYAVREEVEVLKEQIKELIEKNSQLEQENTLLKTLASPEQLAQFQAQLQTGSPPSSSQSQGTAQQPAQPASQGSGPSV